MLARLGAWGACLPLVQFRIRDAYGWVEEFSSFEPVARKVASLTSADEQLLEELQRANFLFFWEQASPLTGLVKDRSLATGKDDRDIASIAATGFGLTALCIGAHRGYIGQAQARDRALATLRFLWERFPHKAGFFFHFVNMQTGERHSRSEVSSIDTAILLCGVLTCRQHFAELLPFAGISFLDYW